MKKYDVAIIGSGQGGSPLAQAFAAAGRSTAMIESTHAGGTCVNVGCTPTKTMVASGRAAHVVNGAKALGTEIDSSSVHLNIKTVRQRKRDIVDMFRGGSERRLQNTANLDLLMGKAKFVSSTELEVTMNDTKEVRTVQADKIFINAGCTPSTLKITGADLIEPKRVLTSTTIMEVDEVPDHLLVIGGGPIGLEFAQLFRRFGSSVSIIARSSHILPNEDPDVATEMEKILTEDGITLHISSKTQEFVKSSTSGVTLQLTTSSGETKSISASHVLNATGRTPSTKALNLEAAGVTIDDRGFIKVNEHLETSTPSIYALGDIKGGPAFTHISYDDFRIIKHNLLTHPSAPPISITNREIPYCIFTDPQLGRIGLTETQARKLYPGNTSRSTSTDKEPTPRIAATSMPMTYIARPLETGESRGLMKAVIDRETDKILGFACLGVEGGEVMTVVQVAMKGGLTWRQMRDGCFAHPCLVEGFNGLFGGFGED